MINNIKFEVIKKIAETNFRIKNLENVSKLNSNSPPSVFVGSRLKYPLVNIGILSPLDRDENAWVYDDAKYWAENNFQISDVINLRNSLLNSRFQSKVNDSRLNKKFVQIAQEIAIASKPVDIEIELKNRLNIGSKRDKILIPHGMRAGLKNARIISNTKIHRKIDKVINDEIKASEGIEYLYKNNFSEYVLSKILSVGVFGLKKDKKFVPTRWSITATDDIIGKRILQQIKDYKWIEDYELFFGDFMGNCYLLLFFPDVFSYELFELYLPGSSWNPLPGPEQVQAPSLHDGVRQKAEPLANSPIHGQIKAATDYESYSGRKNYASSTGGGYYATRLPILEYLNNIKRQASVLAIRIETPSYWAALGVWVVRESVRKALNNKGMKFDCLNKMIETTKKIGKIKYDFDPTQIIKKSKLLKQIKTQTKITDFMIKISESSSPNQSLNPSFYRFKFR